MRLLHPATLFFASFDQIPKTVISHAWSELFKWKASKKQHPKMFLRIDEIGKYLAILLFVSSIRDVKLHPEKIDKTFGKRFFAREVEPLGEVIKDEIRNLYKDATLLNGLQSSMNDYWNADIECFDDHYLFSDACSLYYKGVNIFPYIFESDWRKYVPVESHEEILRQVTKTINSKK
jgi:hypothetical protein